MIFSLVSMDKIVSKSDVILSDGREIMQTSDFLKIKYQLFKLLHLYKSEEPLCMRNLKVNILSRLKELQKIDGRCFVEGLKDSYIQNLWFNRVPSDAWDIIRAYDYLRYLEGLSWFNGTFDMEWIEESIQSLECKLEKAME